jgi:pimeloyl-ACP methyl ester carboxylesterase
MTRTLMAQAPRSRFYISRRLRLHYVEWGEREAPPLVLVHGGLDHCRSWDWLAERLADGFRVLAPDLAGHGDSDHAIGGFYALTDFVADLVELFEEAGLQRAALLGHSMGGGVSSLFAGAFPERIARLVLIEGLRPVMPPPESAAERLRSWTEQTRSLSQRQPKAYESIEAACGRMREANPRLSATQARHLTEYGMRRDPDGLWRWKYDNFVRSRSPARLTVAETASLWGRIDSPVLLIGGADSGRPDPTRNGWIELFANARSVIAPDAGHWVHHDQLDLVARLVRRFLEAPIAALAPNQPFS